MRKFGSIPAVLAVAALMVISGCGSRSDDDFRASWARALYPTLSENTNPAGARIDRRSSNFFGVSNGDNWVYDRTTGTTTSQGALTVRASNVDANGFTLTETEDGANRVYIYRRTSDGIVLTNPLPDAPARAQATVGEMLWFPEPFYPVGAKRTMVRQGSWGADLDNDGAHESFRYVVEQTFLGFETIQMPSGPVETARFQTVSALTIIPSNPNAPQRVSATARDTWWAPRSGLVGLTISNQPVGATTPTVSTYRLARGVVGGISIMGGGTSPTANAPTTTSPPSTNQPATTQPPAVEGTVLKLDLPHGGLTYDAARGAFYATVTGGDQKGRVAVINANTGAVSFTEPFGDQLSAMSVSSDGRYLYVAVRETGEIVKYDIAANVAMARTRIQPGPNGERYYAQNMAVWPRNPTYVVASLMVEGSTPPRHAGVALIQTGRYNAPVTLGPVGNDMLAFDASGDTLYGLTSFGSAGGITRSNFPYGVSIDYVSHASPAGRIGSSTLDVTPQGVWAGNELRSPSTLSMIGEAKVTGKSCRGTAIAQRSVCIDSDPAAAGSGRVAVIDNSNLNVVSTVTYASSGLTAQPVNIVVGGPKQVVLLFGPNANGPYTSAWVVKSDKLP